MCRKQQKFSAVENLHTSSFWTARPGRCGIGRAAVNHAQLHDWRRVNRATVIYSTGNKGSTTQTYSRPTALTSNPAHACLLWLLSDDQLIVTENGRGGSASGIAPEMIEEVREKAGASGMHLSKEEWQSRQRIRWVETNVITISNLNPWTGNAANCHEGRVAIQ